MPAGVYQVKIDDLADGQVADFVHVDSVGARRCSTTRLPRPPSAHYCLMWPSMAGTESPAWVAVDIEVEEKLSAVYNIFS